MLSLVWSAASLFGDAVAMLDDRLNTVTHSCKIAVLAFFFCAASCGAALTWRVDFNGASADTLSASNFTGWVVAANNRTQTLSNVDGGPVSSNMTAILTGAGTVSTYERAMSGGAATNLFRDGAQWNTSGGTLNLQLRGLSAGQDYQVRLWNYDYAFGNVSTQHYREVTDGRNVFLGSLTNTSNNVSSGSPLLPSSLYDSRYVLSSTLTAGTGGVISVDIIPGAGNQKINALEVIESGPPPAEITYSGDGFVESGLNDGSLEGVLSLSLARDQFTGEEGDDFLVEGKADIGNVPDGLQASLLRQDDSTLLFVLSGQALSHASADSISNLTLDVLDSAFQSGAAAAVAHSTRTNLFVQFEDTPPPALIYDSTVFYEAVANNGGIDDTTSISLRSDALTGTNGEDFIQTGKVVPEHVPLGLEAVLVRQSATNLHFSLAGLAISHAAADSIGNLTLIFQDPAFVSGIATAVQGFARSDLRITFSDPALPPVPNGFYISWCSVPGARYSLEWTSNLLNFVTVASNIPADLALTGITGAAPPAVVSPVMYRIRVE